MTIPQHVAVLVTVAASPIFPPSFDNNPLLFAWALFARMLVLTLSCATVVRLITRTWDEGLAVNHPVFYHRLVLNCLLTAAILGSGSDVITFLAWGEVTEQTMGHILTLSRIMDGLTMFPFLMGLFVPFWMMWLRNNLWLGNSGDLRLSGALSDLRSTWGSFKIPLKLTIWSSMISVLVAFSKWYLWWTHAQH